MTDALTAAELAEIRGRLQAATLGPWKPVYPYRDESDYVRIFADSTYLGSIGNTDFDPEQIKANAELIAHAPTDVSRLLAEVERLQSENNQYRALYDAAMNNARKLLMEHGNCKRPNGLACTHCRGESELKKMASEWRGFTVKVC